MGRHVVVGAGPVGTSAAASLLELGHDVTIVTRRGTEGPAGARAVAADANDTNRLATIAAGADALYNCANPPYHRWPELWPPLAAAMLSAAERTGAVLVTMSNLYGYGPVTGPITEDLPLVGRAEKLRIRAKMWQDALAAHEAGRVRATEARASDFLGPGAASLFTTLIAPSVLRGRPALVPANVDIPHSMTFTGDAGRTLATLGTDSRALGRPWHVPSPPAQTLRALAGRLAELANVRPARLRRMSGAILAIGGLFNAEAREFATVRYQFEQPWVLDSSAAEQTFGLRPTSTDDALRSLLN